MQTTTRWRFLRLYVNKKKIREPISNYRFWTEDLTEREGRRHAGSNLEVVESSAGAGPSMYVFLTNHLPYWLDLALRPEIWYLEGFYW